MLDGRVEGSLGKLLLHYALEKRSDEDRPVGATGVIGREEAPRGIPEWRGALSWIASATALEEGKKGSDGAWA